MKSSARPITTSSNAELADFFRANDAQAIASGQATSNQEWVSFAADGRRILLETTKVPMLGADGQPMGVLGVGHDITEWKRTNDELLQHRLHLQELVLERTRELEAARDIAEAASLSKSSFLANMSHEIRTPLNAITGLAYVMKRNELSPEQAERLDKIDRAGRHLLGVINNILDISKIEAEKLDLEAIDFSVIAIFANIASMMSERAQDKRPGDLHFTGHPGHQAAWRPDPYPTGTAQLHFERHQIH